jgi:miniconductance mechanosensitive channel
MENLEENLQKSSHFINKYSYDQLIAWGIDERWASYVNLLVLILVTVIGVYVVHFIVWRILRQILIWFGNEKRPFLGYLKNNRFARSLALVAPAGLIKASIPIVFDNYPSFIKPLDALLDIYIVFMIIAIIMSVLNAVGDNLRENTSFGNRPISSYLQVVKIIFYLFGAIIIFSKLTGKDPVAFFSVMGAASAILLLMFKDTIMGFVASIQVTTNDMVRIGDWIEMPKYGADGDVIEMTLTTVKVQNWDKTITTLPTHVLITDSFKNWQGMREFGGRRLKRSIMIKQSTIRYIKDDELDRFKAIQGIRDFITERKLEIDLHNERIGADRRIPVNGRNLTNAGLFRKYATWYIENHPGVHKDKTIMVRQLAPTEHGLPFELYLFTNTVAWVGYESIAGDIFDHLIAAVKYFDLEIFEVPTGTDVSRLTKA